MNPTTARLNRSASDLSPVKLKSTTRASSSRKDAGKDTLPQAKIQALEQFVKFGRKGKPKKDDKTVEFPPASWLPTSSDTGSGINSVPRPVRPQDTHPNSPAQPPSHTNSTNPRLSPGTLRRRASVNGLNLTSEVNAVAAQSSSGASQSPTLERRGSSFPGPGVIDNQPTEESAPEPLTLARRIQALLSSDTVPPTPSATDGTSTSGAARSGTAGPATPGGSVSQAPAPAPINDSRFLALLGNANIMSGSLDKGRQSVFAILDRLRRPSARATEAPTGSAPSPVQETREEAEEYDDGSSIMLYGPIVPSEDSEVELAASDIMSVFDDGESLEFEQPSRPLSFVAVGEQLTRSNRAAPPPATSEGPLPQGGSDHTSQHSNQGEQGASGWFDTLKGRVIEGGKLVSDKVAGGTKSLKENVAEGRKVVKTKTRWVPSRDKISFQATWWGYRLYLPPPVLDVLNNTRLEAAKRAAILTTALQWLLGHVPLTVVPPQFRLGFVIAQRLVPYLGYIGGFVAWSWGAMKSFDKGHGIVLTATWLLPVALIPGTWEPDKSTDPGDASGARPPPESSTSNSTPSRP